MATDIQVMRLLCAVYPTRLERVASAAAYRLYVASEHLDPGAFREQDGPRFRPLRFPANVVDWYGDRFDDVRVYSLRARAWWHVRQGTSPGSKR